MIRKRREPGRIALPMPPELIKRIDEYRWAARVESRAEAVRILLDEALKRHERHPQPAKDD